MTTPPPADPKRQTIYPLYASTLTSSNEVDPPSIATVGGKGLSLIQHSQNFPVPTGFVLSVAFFDPWLAQIQLSNAWAEFVSALPDPSKSHCDAIQTFCTSQLGLTTSQRQDLAWAIGSVFDGATSNDKRVLVAIRSSSPEEDLVQTSFAGGYESTLGVPLRQEPALLRAIVHSFASLFDYRVVQYKKQNHLDLLHPRIAIVVQQQIASDVSGVAFSLNPLNNCYDEAVISANFGLGESVVSGVVTPDTFVVDKVRRTILSQQVSSKESSFVLGVDGGMIEEKKTNPSEQTLKDHQILQVADLVTCVEAHMGVPSDIEWAIHGGKLYLLQARPITTYIPLFPEMVTPPGAPKKLYVDFLVLSQGFSTPLSPLGLDIWSRLLRVAKPQFTHGADGHLWEIHGRQFAHMTNILGSSGGETFIRKAFEAFGGSIWRTVNALDFDEYRPTASIPQNRWMVLISLKNGLTMLPSLLRGLWNPSNAMKDYLTNTTRFVQLYGTNGHEDHARNPPVLFGELVERAFSELDNIMWSVAGIALSLYSKSRLSAMFANCEEAQEWLVSLNMDLQGNPTSEMGRAMLHLATFPELQVTTTPEEFCRNIEKASYSTEFLEAYKDFQVRFGCRGIKEIDIATPRMYETPQLLFQQLKHLDIHDNPILTVRERKQNAYQKLLDIATRMGKKSTFEYHANVLAQMGGYREHPKYMFTVLVAFLRRRALELSQTWVDQGRLDRVEEIFDLTVEQITQAQHDPNLELSNWISENKASYAAAQYDWPEVIDSRGKILRAPPPVRDVEDGVCWGDPISPGVVEGYAKVLSDPYEQPLNKGEILVTKATEPSWTPVFVNAAGVVLEVGGPLQHGAIIAREYGIPCVSGADRATQQIRSGDLIQVDGTNGVVRIVKAAATE